MTCRQYTCANCWNQAEGACLTCAPLSVTSIDAIARSPPMTPPPCRAAPRRGVRVADDRRAAGDRQARRSARPTGPPRPTSSMSSRGSRLTPTARRPRPTRPNPSPTASAPTQPRRSAGPDERRPPSMTPDRRDRCRRPARSADRGRTIRGSTSLRARRSRVDEPTRPSRPTVRSSLRGGCRGRTGRTSIVDGHRRSEVAAAAEPIAGVPEPLDCPKQRPPADRRARGSCRPTDLRPARQVPPRPEHRCRARRPSSAASLSRRGSGTPNRWLRQPAPEPVAEADHEPKSRPRSAETELGSPSRAARSRAEVVAVASRAVAASPSRRLAVAEPEPLARPLPA